MEFRRDRLTWVAYGLLAWFAFLQAAPGLIVPHLRDELDLSYSIGGLHVASFAAGSVIAGLVAGRVERRLGRRRLFWFSAALMALGTVALTLGRAPVATIGALFVMGVGGALLLITIQAALADHHGERRAIALTEANVAAAVSYVVLIGVLSLAAALSAGWRAALLASLVAARGALLAQSPPGRSTRRRRRPSTPPACPAVFWIATAMLFCTTAAEWCITAWGASFVEDAADVSVDTAVALMVGFYTGFVAGRVLGSRLTRAHAPHRLLALALAVTAAGFAILWPAASPLQAVLGLLVVGIGLGNLFPLGLAVTVDLDRRPRPARLEPGDAGRVARRPARAADRRHAGRRHLAHRRPGRGPGRADDRGPGPDRRVHEADGPRRRTHSTRSNPPARTRSRRPVRHPRTASRTSGVGRSR